MTDAARRVATKRPSREVGAAGAASAGAAAALTAAGVGACCVSPVISPVIVTVLGAGGAAWAAGLKPYSPYMLAGSLALLGYGFWTAYRRPACAADGSISVVPRSRRWVRVALWSAALLWLASAGVNVFLRS